jgi:hypothetical protein
MQSLVFFRAIIVLLLLLAFGKPCHAQEAEPEYEEEISYGINWNTNGGLIGGGMFKYARQLSNNRYHSFGIEIVNVKHPKELTYPNRNNTNFIANKLNYLVSVRPQYGREFILFRKAPEDGVHLNAIIAAGPTFGVIKPYYIQYEDPTKPADGPVTVPYDPAIHSLNRIDGPGSPFDGLDRLSLVMGMHAKASLSFEFGKFNSSLIGAEIGLLGEVFPKKIDLMSGGAVNKSSFGSAFFTLYYGNKY